MRASAALFCAVRKPCRALELKALTSFPAVNCQAARAGEESDSNDSAARARGRAMPPEPWVPRSALGTDRRGGGESDSRLQEGVVLDSPGII